MTCMRIGAALVAMLIAGAPAWGDLGTHSFTNHAGGTHPNTLALTSGSIVVDLSAIAGVEVHRATLDPGIDADYIDVTQNSLAGTTMEIRAIESAAAPLRLVGGKKRPAFGGGSEPLLPPRYDKFDVTGAVRSALATGGGLTLIVVDAGPGFGASISLDVLCDRSLPGSIGPATDVSARFERGDAMITFTEPDPPLAGDSAQCADFYTVLRDVDDTHKMRYRIYRSDESLDNEAALAAADLIDEIKPLSGWNPRRPGPGGGCYSPYGSGTVYTLPISDTVRAAGSTGIYVDRFTGTTPDTAYYFVSRAVDGAEDFSGLGVGTSASGSVYRTAGPGMVVLDEIRHEPEFNYGASAGQYYYVKWEAPPGSNFPNSPCNYLVAVPSAEFAVAEPGVNLGLHCWGGNLNSCYGWWYAFEQGHLLVAGNQFPFEDWWTGYHENLGTLKSRLDGTVKPFTPHRLVAFLYDFVAGEYGANLDRVLLAGGSMGGSGTSMVGLRNGHLFANLISWVGVHIPRETPTFAGSYEKAWGSREWNVPFSNEEFAARFGGMVIRPEDGYGVWDYYDNDQWLRANVDVPTPWMTFSNGVDDGGIGWEQAVTHTDALIDTWRPFNFQWGMNGHSQRVALLDPYGYDKTQKSHLVFDRNESHPAFRNGSADDDFHTDSAGKMNAYLSWDPSTGVDETGRWEMTIFIPDAPSGGSYGVVFPESLTTDVFPVRLREFAIVPGAAYDWIWSDAAGAGLFASGTVIADSSGRIFAPDLVVKKNEPRRLAFTAGAVGVAIDAAGGGTAPEQAIVLEPNRPNPFNPTTEFAYTLSAAGRVQIAVFDISGRPIRHLADGHRTAGMHRNVWDGLNDKGRRVPSGLYFCRISAGNHSVARKMILMR